MGLTTQQREIVEALFSADFGRVQSLHGEGVDLSPIARVASRGHALAAPFQAYLAVKDKKVIAPRKKSYAIYTDTTLLDEMAGALLAGDMMRLNSLHGQTGQIDSLVDKVIGMGDVGKAVIPTLFNYMKAHDYDGTPHLPKSPQQKMSETKIARREIDDILAGKVSKTQTMSAAKRLGIVQAPL